MNRLLRNANIVDPTSTHHGTQTDLLIVDGTIQQIEGNIQVKNIDDLVDLKGGYLSPGWLDIGAQTGDPGLEHREDLAHITEAALRGGFTGLACFPNTKPSIHSKSEVHYLLQQTRHSLLDLFPIGALSQDCAGQDITEMLDMQAAGAVAFSDGKKPVRQAGLLLRALLYAKSFDGVILNHPHDKGIIPGGQMHEGTISTQLGMKGIPALAESLMVQRDIDLLRYSESRLHLHNISTARSVALIREAKAQGLDVTCSVPAINLFFTEQDLLSFDSNLKVLPPLRTAADKAAIIEGLQDGTIDIICSNHVPLELEAKQLEFAYADFGAIGLETTYAALQTGLGEMLSTGEIVDKLAIQPRKMLNLMVPSIAVGQSANCTVFDPKQRWVFQEADIYSKSKNTPFIGKELTGRVLAIIKGDQSRILQDW